MAEDDDRIRSAAERVINLDAELEAAGEASVESNAGPRIVMTGWAKRREKPNSPSNTRATQATYRAMSG